MKLTALAAVAVLALTGCSSATSAKGTTAPPAAKPLTLSKVTPGALKLVPIPGAPISTILRSPQIQASTYSALELRALGASGGFATQASLIADTVVLNGAVSMTSPTTILGLPVYANNAAAITGGLGVGTLYRNGGDPDQLFIVH